jgi:imidazolonepropionase-like amidohydrolase
MAAILGAVAGAVVAPVAKWVFFRQISVDRAALFTTIGTIAGSLIGEIVRPLREYAHSAPGYIFGMPFGLIAGAILVRLLPRSRETIAGWRIPGSNWPPVLPCVRRPTRSSDVRNRHPDVAVQPTFDRRLAEMFVAAALIALLPLQATVAQARVSALITPPAGARHFIIESIGGKHGDSWSWTLPDGRRMARETMSLRGFEVDIDYTGTPGTDRMPAALTIRGSTTMGDVAETLSVVGDSARWKSPVDAGSTIRRNQSFYIATNGPVDVTAWFVERLLASPDRSMKLLPGGEARATKLTSLDVGAGTAKRTISLWSITGLSNTPVPIWTDTNGAFFGLTGMLSWLPENYAGEMQRMLAAQADAMAQQSASIVKLAKKPDAPVAFTHVRVFDADGLRFLNDQTVVVSGANITGVAPSGQIAVPEGAQIIRGDGMTLLPGLWDCHMHIGDDYTGPQELSLGVTSVRDPGNDDKQTLDRRARANAGRLLFPHVYPSSLIDGKGPYTAQVGSVATSEMEAIALVRQAKTNGFTGIKIYGTFDPVWLPATIAEAHRLGLHVHGHIPHGIRPMEAIDDGYDEITHINWVMMQAMPESILPQDNGLLRVQGPGRFAKDVDLDGPALTTIVQTMARKHIYADPTMVAFEQLYVPDNGELSPAYAALVGTLPPATERGFRAGGLAVPKDLARADYRASWAKMVGLLSRMHAAGVPIVAGTDGSGLEIIRELEIYRDAGFTAAEAIAAATIVPARLVGQDAHTGSIKSGKTADLVLVEGDPSQRIGDLRQTRVVMLNGLLLDADSLRQAAGFSGRPGALRQR